MNVSPAYQLPSGNWVVLREMNGEDEDILTNPHTVTNLMNLSYFISGIVVEYDGHKLSVSEALDLPVLDRYAILVWNHIFSMDNLLEFTYDWGPNDGGVQHYVQDLYEVMAWFLSDSPMEKVNPVDGISIPFYPLPTDPQEEFETTSGKKLRLTRLTGAGEQYFIMLPLEKRTRNQDFIARNLEMEVNGKWEKVTNFRLFSIKDMKELRVFLSEHDPQYTGNIPITGLDGQQASVNLLGLPGFLIPGEI